MSTKTQEYIEEMGKTGAGIEREADINMDTPNAFTTKWGTYSYGCYTFVFDPNDVPIAQIKAVWPWFFEMQELIGERPNVIPAGLGNSRLISTFLLCLAVQVAGATTRWNLLLS